MASPLILHWGLIAVMVSCLIWVLISDIRSLTVPVFPLLLLTVTGILMVVLADMEKVWVLDIIPVVLFAISVLFVSLRHRQAAAGAADWWLIMLLCLVVPIDYSLPIVLLSSIAGLIHSQLAGIQRIPFAFWISVFWISELLLVHTGFFSFTLFPV